MYIFKNSGYGGKQFCVSHSTFLNEIRMAIFILIYVVIINIVLPALFTKLKNFKFSRAAFLFQDVSDYCNVECNIVKCRMFVYHL
jgi:hypothetical protein